MAGVAGATLGTGLFPTNVLAAKAPNAAPKPTSNQITLNGVTFSLTFFGPGIDPSSIGDFNGFVGVGEFAGGTGKDQTGKTLYWGADVRFMDGEYVGLDGRHRQGAFAFV